MFGQFDFNATPLAPPGTKVVTHIKPGERNTWELHGEKGFYVGPAIDHYRCVQCYFPRTRARRVCDTVAFLAHAVPFPEVTIKDHLQQAASDIISILTQPPSTTVPSLQAGDPTRNALLQIAEQLHRVETIPQPINTTPKQNPRKARSRTHRYGRHYTDTEDNQYNTRRHHSGANRYTPTFYFIPR